MRVFKMPHPLVSPLPSPRTKGGERNARGLAPPLVQAKRVASAGTLVAWRS